MSFKQEEIFVSRNEDASNILLDDYSNVSPKSLSLVVNLVHTTTLSKRSRSLSFNWEQINVSSLLRTWNLITTKNIKAFFKNPFTNFALLIIILEIYYVNEPRDSKLENKALNQAHNPLSYTRISYDLLDLYLCHFEVPLNDCVDYGIEVVSNQRTLVSHTTNLVSLMLDFTT